MYYTKFASISGEFSNPFLSWLRIQALNVSSSPRVPVCGSRAWVGHLPVQEGGVWALAVRSALRGCEGPVLHHFIVARGLSELLLLLVQ